MNRHSNIKTAAICMILLALLCLLAGAARKASSLQVGRFQMSHSSSGRYVIDTATGQVWSSGSREFYQPKLQLPPAGLAVKAQDFIGQWRSDDEDATLWLEEGGAARATSDDKEYEGRWSVAGSQITVDIADETIKGEIAPSGRLILWEEDATDDTRVPFRRVE